MKRYTLYNLIVKRLLITCLFLAGVAGQGWGQTYTITPQPGKTFPQTNIPEMVDTIYIANNEGRELIIPELTSLGDDEADALQYRWNIRWYRMNPENKTVIESGIKNYLTNKENLYKEANNGQSLFWYYPFWPETPQGIDLRKLGKVTYTKQGTDEDILICDISINVDGYNENNDRETPYTTKDLPKDNTFYSPTISRRYKFIIREAEKMREQLNGKTEANPLMVYPTTVPKGAIQVNLQVLTRSKCYYWSDNNNNFQGNRFVAKIGKLDENGTFTQSGENIESPLFGERGDRVITLGDHAINENTTVCVYAETENDKLSPCLIRYDITVQENAGFMEEEAVKTSLLPHRNPQNFEDTYAYLGGFDFDIEDTKNTIPKFQKGRIPKADLNVNNNICYTPLSSDETSYGFTDHTLSKVSNYIDPRQNFYGLYRSANVVEASQYSENYKGDGIQEDNQGWGYTDLETGNPRYVWRWNRVVYNWVFARYGSRMPENNPDAEYFTTEFYDRTHSITNGDSCGFFYYVDAAERAGRIFNVPIGELCPGTKLTVTAWVANLSDPDPYCRKPNLNFNLLGAEKLGDDPATNERVLHRFTTGEWLSGTEKDTYLTKWMQVAYTVVISQEMMKNSNYFTVEVQNNTANSSGADYAIDDIRIYKTLPHIKVHRVNECEASTLRISSNYETILNNLGWDPGDDVIEVSELTDKNKRKYRYGLMNDNPYANIANLEYARKTGNIYFSFAYPQKEGANTPWGQDLNDWVTVNKNLLDGSGYDEQIIKGNYHKTIRVLLPTDMLDENKPNDAWSKLPTTQEEAYRKEVMLNVYAMHDFIADTKRGPNGETDPPYWDPEKEWNSQFGLDKFITDFETLCRCTGEWGTNHTVEEVYVERIINGSLLDTYNELKKKMYVYLGIPRIRFPWRSEDGTEIFLTSVYVDNTDLRYKGEQRPGDTEPATGEYYVIIFSARAITEANTNPGANDFDLADPCRLKSPFTVLPATTIKIDTDLENPTTAICEGNLKKITATLNGYDTEGNGVDLKDKDIDYIFDWYLSSREAFEADSIARKDGTSIKTDLKKYRESSHDYGPISIDDLAQWNGDNNIKERLTKLIQDDLLKTGTKGAETFDLLINVPEIVAMPYVYSTNTAETYLFCTDKTPVHFDLSEEDTPGMFAGISGVTYPFPESAPLRLGQLNMEKETILSIPVRQVTDMSKDATRIGINTERGEVMLNNASTTLPVVGTVNKLSIDKPQPDSNGSVNATVAIRWNENAKTYMQEGLSYELLIPFIQYNNDGPLTSACEGLASLPIKVVPEYLTWKGKADDVWYNDDNWDQSTEAELYMGQTLDKDANGNDPIGNTFSPLYFTKITIPETGMLSLKERLEDATDNIQFDMAVNNTGTDGAVTVESYYTNKVSEIYFKPKAKLMNQHYLTYGTARVEFEIANDEKRWMASPLQGVYAGDMYAPSANGRQETEAFEGINYNTTDYSRWSPAFYQKAWNKGIEYFPSNPMDGSTGAESVAAVKSNWSIEYNDVRVPYTIGKGFYLSVENAEGEGTALVRLPKADTGYTYETKPTLRSGENLDKTQAGKLVALSDGSYTLDLKTAVDGDNKHFLVGNPFMTYLNMGKFFEANTSLNKKYWTLANGAPNAAVGTPDVEFEDGSSNGTVEPMQAFFVELKDEAALDDENALTITFTAEMMSAVKVEPTEVTTKSISATHPVLTLTAERGNVKSAARLLTSDKADNGYKADEDAVVLLDSELDAPMVYTVSGSQAAQVNAVKQIQNIGIGVFNKGKDEVTVTIEGLSRMTQSLYLYDAQTRKSVKLEDDSYSLTVSGDSHGRYFLRSGTPTGNEAITADGISIYSVLRGQVIVSALRPVKEIKVFSLNGSQARRFSVNTTQYSFNLPAGIYMIYASDGEQEHTEKIIVR